MTSIRRLPLLVCAVFIAPLFIHTARAPTITNGPYYAMPSWDQTLPAATRFVVLSNFANQAVLDSRPLFCWAIRGPHPERASMSVPEFT